MYVHILEVYLLKYYLKKKTYYMNDAIICRQTILNQLNIMVSYVDIIGLLHSVAIL